MPMPLPPGKTLPARAEPTRSFPASVKRRSDVITCLVASVLARCPWLHMVTVDLWAPQPDNSGPETWEHWPHEIHERNARARLSAFSERVKIIKAYTVRAADDVEDGSLDFVFIDADHSEYGVRSDIMAWTKKLRPRGMLLGHDINWPSVRAAVDALCPGFWIGPDNVWGVEV